MRLAGIDDLASLPIEDRVRFGAFMLSFLRRIGNLVYQTEQGMLDPDSWEGLREALRRIFAHRNRRLVEAFSARVQRPPTGFCRT